MEEIWKDIKGYEGVYQVSNLSRVKSLERVVPSKCAKNNNRQRTISERIRKQTDCGGYLSVPFRVGGKIKHHTVHRLVAIAFIPNPYNKPQVNHINGIKSDNRIENLEWCTASENIRHNFDYLNMTSPSLGRFGKDSNASKQVGQFTGKGELIAKFGSVLEAERLTKISRHIIYNSASSRTKLTTGFTWEYINN